MEMNIEPEDTAKIIDAIYKNLIYKFNPCATELITAGKAYLKALQGLTAASNLFNKSLSKIAVNAQQSFSSDVGDALLRVISIQKGIQEHQVNIVKTFYADLLMPLETNLEKDIKVVQSEQKKFLQQHKLILESNCKAASSLRKQRKKKNSSRLSDKELKILQNIEEEKLKLKIFCSLNFKSAVLQERRRYGFILERQCSIAKHWITYHETGKQLFEDQLDDLIHISGTRESFTFNLDEYFTKKIEELKDPVTANLRKSRSMDVASSSWKSNNEHGDIDQNSLPRTKSEHNLTTTNSSTGDEAVTKKNDIVSAVYRYEASGKNQLSFEEGDRIVLIGNSANGWQFGENLRTKMLGWLPETYMEYENLKKKYIQSNELISSTSKIESNRELEASSSRVFGDSLSLQSTKYFQLSSSDLRSPPSVLPPPIPNISQYQLHSNQIYSNPDQYVLEKSTSQGNKTMQNKEPEINDSNDSTAFHPPPQPEIDYSDEEKSIKSQLRNKNIELKVSRKPASLESINSNTKNDKNRKDNFIKRTKSFWRSKKTDEPQSEINIWKHKDIIKNNILSSNNKVETVDRHKQNSLQRNNNRNQIVRNSQNLIKISNNDKKRNLNTIGSEVNMNSKNKNPIFNYDDSVTTGKVLETNSFDDRDDIIKTVTRREILKQYYSSDSDSEKKSIISDQYDCIIIEDHLVQNKNEFKSLPSNIFTSRSREINMIEACSMNNNNVISATLLPRTKLNKISKFNTTQKVSDKSDNSLYTDASLCKAYGPWYNLWEEQNIKNMNTQ